MHEDTIAAIATASGDGGIAVIRISGPDSAAIAASIFRPRSGGEVARFTGYTVHYGVITDRERGATIDDALLTVFRAPRSYTGEDVCEIAYHGGSATSRIVLDLVLQAGGRIALPGEFTQRAFLNGRMDLAQAEAVADLIRARTESARKLARRQLEGDVSHAAAAIREDLIGIVAAIEVTIDFSDEVGELDHADIRSRIDLALDDILRLLSSADRGRILREGLQVAIIGRPNAGKSSLLNAMLRSDRAIVTPHPGTTRDTIEESVSICGMSVVLMDTAGLRDTVDSAAERIGVERTIEAAKRADLALYVLDAFDGVTSEDIALVQHALEADDCIVVCNKRDLVDEMTVKRLLSDSRKGLGLEASRVIAVSAVTTEGIDRLEQMLVEPIIGAGAGELSSTEPAASVVVSSARHVSALEAARASLVHAGQSALDEMPGDFIALDVRGALDALGQITGETVTEDIIHRIFADFCVGK